MRDAILEQSDEEIVEMGALSRSPGFLLRLAQVKAFEAFFEHTSPLNIKPGEFTVLWVIALNPGLKQGSIARKLHIKPAHMTKLIGRMVKDGLVERHTPSDDRRAVRLTLTKAGEQFVDNNHEKFLDVDMPTRVALTDTEAEQLNALLVKFIGLNQNAT